MGVELVEYELSDIRLAGHTYSIVGYMPQATAVFQSSAGGPVSFLAEIAVGNREMVGCCRYDPGKKLRVLVFSCEQNGPEMHRLIRSDRLDEDAVLVDLSSPAHAETILRRLHERAAALQLSLRATLLEIEGESDESDDDFAVINAFTAGLPPLVLIGEAGFSFPVRSGLPAGILPEWFTQEQKLEWQRGEQLFCHTDLPGSNSGTALRSFHNLLKKGAYPTELPDDLVMLRVRFLT